jgi:hypothetical protein
VTVGKPGWYRVDGDPRELDPDGLAGVLQTGADEIRGRGGVPEVWMRAAREEAWEQVSNAVLTCQGVGIWRVGLLVSAESGDGLMGFPLFLPHRASVEGEGTGTARRLEVDVKAQPRRPSHGSRLFAATQVAVERFGPIVADVRIGPEVGIGHAVRVLDLLWRGGVAAIRIKYGMMGRPVTGEPEIHVEGRLLPETALEAEPPAVRPRAEPWGDDGAAQPGALGWALEDLPSGPAGTGEEVAPLPSYAGAGGEVPVEAIAEAQDALATWSKDLSASLTNLLTTSQFKEDHLVERKRSASEADRILAPARRAFPTATEARVTTLRIHVFLFRESQPVGKADVTLDLSGERPGLVFGAWVAEAFPERITLPPMETDPFASGVPGHLRVWIEALFAALKVRDEGSLPFATEAEVLRFLPAVAHPGVRAALAGRPDAVKTLAEWLRARPYDRLYLLPSEGNAAVAVDRAVGGVLRFGLESEDGQLRLNNLTPKVAPR